MSYLDPEHIQVIADVYDNWNDVKGFSRVVDIEEVLDNQSDLSIPLYVKTYNYDGVKLGLNVNLENWLKGTSEVQSSMDELFDLFDKLNAKEEVDE